MYIKSIRYGFANNSSSSHSIVFLGNYKAKDESNDGDFGWSNFTASSKESKREYLFATLLDQRKLISYIPKTALTEKVGWANPFEYDDVIKKLKINWAQFEELQYQDKREKIEFGEKILKNMEWNFISENFSDVFSKGLIEKWRNFENPYERPTVDHQSLMSLPVNLDGSIHVGFAKSFFSVLIEKNFAFLGGNDNGGNNHHLKSQDTYSDDLVIIAMRKVLELIEKGGYRLLCIYDAENDDFVLQNDNRGDKIRISFNSDKKTTKSSFPELVDLKITDNCEFACNFCYQSSTKDGEHASLEKVEKTLKILANSGVMEIAIGGGEPTNHPNLLKILKDIKSYNMLACFTTKNFNLHERLDFVEILEATDSIAFSCNSIAEIKKFEIITKALYDSEINFYKRPKLYIQMIPELITNKVFENILEYISFNLDYPVTLLGYKDFGFGEKYKPKNIFSNSDWIKIIKKYSEEKDVKFGIDSILVSKWKKELIENHVDPLALVGEEGKFSCYLDAVKMTIHKSSFSKEEGIQLTGKEKDIKKQFATF